jgi:hypothetical protein
MPGNANHQIDCLEESSICQRRLHVIPSSTIHSSIHVLSSINHSSSNLHLGRPDRTAPSLLIRLDLVVHGTCVMLDTLLRNDIRSTHHETICSEDGNGNGAIDPASIS